MTEQQIQTMVNRFLGWKLPADFAPDAGISFKPLANADSPVELQYKHEPIGTNLFTADQAKAMLLYLTEGLELPVLEGEPEAWMNPGDLCADTAFRWCKLDEFTKPVYTHPAPFTPITADMVTYKMMVECNNNADTVLSPADFAAAVNTWGAKK
jgi:hypothetical protein